MWGNALVQRYRASHLRTWSMVVYLGIYAVVVALVTMTCIATAPWPDSRALRETLTCLFFYLAAAQAVLLWGWATYNSAQTIRLEHERKSYDFFRMLPLTAREKTVGILVGRNLPVLLLVAVNTVLMLLTAPEQLLHAQMQCVIWAVAALLNTVALLVSCAPHAPRARRRTSTIAVVVLCIFLFQGIFGLFFGIMDVAEDGNPLIRLVPFGPTELPAFLAIVLVSGTLAAWCYTGVLRRLTVEDMPLFSTRGAVGFTASLLALLLLFLAPHAREQADRLLFGIVLVAGFALSILAMAGSARLARHDLEDCRRAGTATAGEIRTRMIWQSNLVTAWLLAAVALGALLCMAAAVDLDPPRMLDPALGAVLAYAFAALLIELHALYGGAGRHVPLLTAFAALLYIIFPLILSTLTETPIALLSGVNYMFARLVEPAGFDAATLGLVAAHAVLLPVLFLAVRRRVFKLADTAAAM